MIYLFLNEIKDILVKKLILEKTDLETINAIENFKGVKIKFQENKGYGSAIVEGIAIADTEYFCIINADGSMNPSYLKKCMKI